MVKIEELLKGYGPKFPPLEELFGITPSEAEIVKLEAPTAALGRYFDGVKFMSDITSGKAIGKKRFKVLMEYFIQLGDLFDGYTGIHKDKKVVSGLSDDEKRQLRMFGTSLAEIVQAEKIESFTEHDTAAAGDYLKLKVGTIMPRLIPMLEGFHFACTSEDVMSIVFGKTLNEIVYGHLIPTILDFEETFVKYVESLETEEGKPKPLILPALTHKQAAEPTTLGKKVANIIKAINYHLDFMQDRDGNFIPFSGKMSGAVGNFTTHYAAYPDIDWETFAKKFVEGFGLKYESMTNQAVSYAVEIQHFTTIANMLSHILKFTEDFVDSASCPGQLFVKTKKAGTKGSSIMPNKSNAWQQEGAQKMLTEARDKFLLYAKELPDYPHEGNMGRSYMMREVATIFMPIFIGLNRISKEINGSKERKGYVPNHEKIDAFFREYPGMAGSAIQTVLKREGIPGDAYRAIEKIAINPDGTYANAEQFKRGLERTMEELNLSPGLRTELNDLLEPKNLVKKANELAANTYTETKNRIAVYREKLKPYIRENAGVSS